MPREEAERVDTLRYSWEKLNASAVVVQDHLVSIQNDYKGDLLEKVEVFIKDTTQYYEDYAEVCLMFLSLDNYTSITQRDTSIMRVV